MAMDKIKVIKTEKDYQEALSLIEILLQNDPDPDSVEGEKLSLLAALVEDYESSILPESLPDPVDAILFRMEQANLKPADLVPYIGSRSKVSEILSRKRSLTLSMMRALQAGLGIPAKVLLKEVDEFRDPDNVAWNSFPIREMEKREYFGSRPAKSAGIKDLMESFFSPMGTPSHFVGMLKKANYVRASRPMDRHALVVWSAYILKQARKIKYPKSFTKGSVDLAFMRDLSRLSADPKGPIRAAEVLREIGIGLVAEAHFPKTYLDGAAIMTERKHPVIGVTLRHDRLDNFWFTLLHELAHIALHYNSETNLFFDDLDSEDLNKLEAEADRLAEEALIPRSKWENSPARLIPSAIAAESLASELGIHVAVVAGRMRYYGQHYQYLTTLVNQATVRQYFPQSHWDN